MKIDTNWHSWSEELLCQGLKTNSARGLPKKEVSKRLHKNGPNTIWKVGRVSTSQFALQTLLDLATILLVIVAVIATVFEKTGETFAILAVISVGAAVRVLSYIYSRRIFEEKARGVIPRVRVIREGEVRIVSSEKLVDGDIVFLEAGDTVPADLRILSSNELLVFENKITENKAVIFKNSAVINEEAHTETPIEKRNNMLYAGTTVVSGDARCVVVATGNRTLAASKFGTLLIPSGEKIKLTEKLTKWSRIESLLMIIVVALLTVLGFVLKGGDSVFETLLAALSLAVASMSEFFIILGNIVIAVAVKRADDDECGFAKIKDASSVEELDRVDTFVLESPDMIKAGDVTLTSYCMGTRLINVNEPVEGVSPAGLLKMAYLTTGTLPQGSLSGGYIAPERESDSVDYSEIHKAYEEYFDHSFENRNIENIIIAGHEAAGSLESGGLDTVLICTGADFEAIIGGSVERVIPCCSHIRKDGEVCSITREDVMQIAAECEKLKARGIYTVGIAKRSSPYTNMNRVSALQMCMTFEGFLALADRAHGDALDVIRKSRESRCHVVCFTEGSDEDKAFLRLIGILEENDRYITLEEAAGMEAITLEDGVFAAISTGYASPEKLRREYIRKLKKGGHAVAYISKEPKDMWAMKEASVSFAVPPASVVKKTIPQSIRAASDVIVTPAGNGGGVFEAFRITEYAKCAMLNLRRCTNYLIASQFARFLIAVLTIVTGLSTVDPVQLLIWGLLLDFAVVIVTAFRSPPWNMISIPKEKRQLPKSKTDFIKPALIGTLWCILTVSIPLFLLYARDVSLGLLSNMIFTSNLIALPIAATELMTNSSMFKKSKRRSRSIPLMIVGCIVLSLIFAFSKDISALLVMTPITFKLWLLCFIPAAVLFIFFEIKKLITYKKNK